VIADCLVKGMSLRDWFAGMAMQGMLAAGPGSDGWVACEDPNDLAQACLEYADAMLAEREKAE
jgi:hypothetical protein